MDDPEHRRIEQAARRKRLTVSEWVRQALRVAARGEPSGSPARKLAAIRSAARHRFPTADIERMNEEIEAGAREGPDA